MDIVTWTLLHGQCTTDTQMECCNQISTAGASIPPLGKWRHAKPIGLQLVMPPLRIADYDSQKRSTLQRSLCRSSAEFRLDQHACTLPRKDVCSSVLFQLLSLCHVNLTNNLEHAMHVAMLSF